jgi:hypothetical protein
MNDIEKAIEKFNYLGNGAPIHNVLSGMERKEKREMFLLAANALEKQLNNGWIPVTERLPNEEECNKFDIMHPNRRKFYCTIQIGDYEPQVRELYFSIFYQWEYDLENYSKHVIAWQPLPEEYKEAASE